MDYDDYGEARSQRESQGLVGCDDLECKAKILPETFEEWKDAAIHWRDHSYLSGCSHAGR